MQLWSFILYFHLSLLNYWRIVACQKQALQKAIWTRRWWPMTSCMALAMPRHWKWRMNWLGLWYVLTGLRSVKVHVTLSSVCRLLRCIKCRVADCCDWWSHSVVWHSCVLQNGWTDWGPVCGGGSRGHSVHYIRWGHQSPYGKESGGIFFHCIISKYYHIPTHSPDGSIFSVATGKLLCQLF